ncbi:MAG: vitamin K epoxide reductase family protein, partial [Patescibacteria group bacterium]
ILDGCDTVTTSKYSAVAGMPVALMGAIYYLVIFILAISYLESKKDRLAFLISRFTIIGFLASLWFVYLQVFVLKALCLYCLFSALTSTALFAISAIFTCKKYRL